MHIKTVFKTSLIVAVTGFFTTPALAQSANWTGFYLGAEIGYADVDADAPLSDGDDLIGGIIGGYDYDMGTWVIGGGVDVDFADISLGGVSLDTLWRLKLRGGYKIGNGLLYATGGYANANFSGASDEDGYFIGGGYEYLTESNFSIGGEILFHAFDNVGAAGADIETVTYQIRGTFRF